MPLAQDEFVFIEGRMKQRAELLSANLESQDFYRVSYSINNGTREMQAYVDGLQRAGLDIGKSGAEFGYRMPLPEKDKTMRDLIIFRRR